MIRCEWILYMCTSLVDISWLNINLVITQSSLKINNSKIRYEWYVAIIISNITHATSEKRHMLVTSDEQEVLIDKNL